MSGNDPTDGGMYQTSAVNASEDRDLDLIFGDWVSQVTGIPRNLCRRRWQESAPTQPPRDTDWCAVGVTQLDPDQNTQAGFVADDYTVRMHETISVLFSFYGLNATQNAMTARIGLNISYNRGVLNDNGIGFLRASPPVRVPAIVNQLTLQRTDITMQFRRQEMRVFPINSVLSSDGTIITDGPASRFIIGTSILGVDALNEIIRITTPFSTEAAK